MNKKRMFKIGAYVHHAPNQVMRVHMWSLGALKYFMIRLQSWFLKVHACQREMFILTRHQTVMSHVWQWLTHTKAEYNFEISRIKTMHIFLQIRWISKWYRFSMCVYHRGSFISKKSIAHDDITIFQWKHRNENVDCDT